MTWEENLILVFIKNETYSMYGRLALHKLQKKPLESTANAICTAAVNESHSEKELE
jgi:hypothetical protein